MIRIEIDSEFIKLDQLLKLAGVVGSGAEAHILIEDNQVKVNEKIENRKRRKLYCFDKVYVLGKEIEICGI